MTVDARAGASGPFVLQATQRRTWDGQANLTLTALPAGHPPGNYSLIGTATVLTAAAGGFITRVLQWRDAGAVQVWTDPNNGSFGVEGPNFLDPVVFHSDGVAAILIEFQPVGVPPGGVAAVSLSVLQQSRG